MRTHRPCFATLIAFKARLDDIGEVELAGFERALVEHRFAAARDFAAHLRALGHDAAAGALLDAAGAEHERNAPLTRQALLQALDERDGASGPHRGPIDMEAIKSWPPASSRLAAALARRGHRRR